jgi:3-methyl-2-oxobutanoate hydroxymethyltransferase
VARGLHRSQATAWLIGDLPFGSYHESKEQALRSAAVLMQAGAHMVKLEGGGWTTEVVHFLVERGIPVCAHLGLTPQTVHALGGYRVQGKIGRQCPNPQTPRPRTARRRRHHAGAGDGARTAVD